MAKEYKITRDRLKELEAELNYLKTTRKKEVAEQIKEARSFGDLSENSEYDEAKNEQAKLYESAVEDMHGVVGLGGTVTVRDLEFDENQVYAIVGSQEANPMEARISDDSPFGRAMLGKKVGETVEFEAPAGLMRFEILAVER